MAFSKAIREQALELCQKGLTDDQVSEKLDISKYTLGNWKRLLFDTGSLEKKKVIRKSGKPYKYTTEKMKELLNKSKLQPYAVVTPKCDIAQNSLKWNGYNKLNKKDKVMLK